MKKRVLIASPNVGVDWDKVKNSNVEKDYGGSKTPRIFVVEGYKELESFVNANQDSLVVIIEGTYSAEIVERLKHTGLRFGNIERDTVTKTCSVQIYNSTAKNNRGIFSFCRL